LAECEAIRQSSNINNSKRNHGMRISTALLLVALVGLATGTAFAAQHGSAAKDTEAGKVREGPHGDKLPGMVHEARAEFIDQKRNSIGTATLTESPHGVLIHLDLKGLPPGPKAIHIHSVGTCEDPDEGFVASKGHLNPDGKEHGLFNPAGPDAGDLPNLYIRDDGTFEAEFFTTLASLGEAEGRARILDEDGAALVIHINRDDHITQPIGGAGPRIACGVVKAAK
jgi:superoxide dismutase, Cu-Zn family